MILDANALVLDLEGKPLTPPRAPGATTDPAPMTFGQAIIAALLHVYPDEPQALDAKVVRFKVASRLARGGDVAMTAEEIAAVKIVIGKYWSPLVVGRVLEALDPAALALPAPAPVA